MVSLFSRDYKHRLPFPTFFCILFRIDWTFSLVLLFLLNCNEPNAATSSSALPLQITWSSYIKSGAFLHWHQNAGLKAYRVIWSSPTEHKSPVLSRALPILSKACVLADIFSFLRLSEECACRVGCAISENPPGSKKQHSCKNWSMMSSFD